MIDETTNRRAFLRMLAAAGAAPALAGPAWTRLARAADPATRPAWQWRPRLARFPEKTEMLLLTDRPPQLEMPASYFKKDITPNDAFFVRWHVSGIPTQVDLQTFHLTIGGHVERPVTLTVEQLKQQFEPVSLVAVAQCSGNSRSFFEPRVAGGQWGNGAIGNAKWTGVRLSDLLDRAGVKSGAVDVSFGGLDRPPLPDTADFVKSLPIERASDGEVMVAYAMNDAPLPMLNGFPLRLIVPGWYATYWVKSLDEIMVLNEKFKGFWMEKAYRIPTTPDAQESPDKLATETVPISAHSVRSLFASPEAGASFNVGEKVEIEGVALDSGKGITQVEVSVDGGQTWSDARLEPEIGRYSWRRWRINWTPDQPGRYRLMARATNAAGEKQTTRQWNRSGYQRNVIEQLDVTVNKA